MFYAVRLGTNPNGKRYQEPIGFIVDEDELPLREDTEEELRDILEGHPLYDAGWVDIIEIG